MTLALSPPSPSKLFRREAAQADALEAAALCRRSHWVPKSSRRTCANCRRAFKLFAGKHHCRFCGEVVCKACSGKRILFRAKSERACDDCIDVNLQSLEASASASGRNLSRRKSLPDARFQGRASPRSLLSTGRRSLPYATGALLDSSASASSGTGSDDPSSRARSALAAKTRSRKDAREWRSVVSWRGLPGHVPSVVLVVCLAVLASLLNAAVRQ